MCEMEEPLRVGCHGVTIVVERHVLTQVKGSKLANDFRKKFDEYCDESKMIEYETKNKNGQIFGEVVEILKKGGHYLPK